MLMLPSPLAEAIRLVLTGSARRTRNEPHGELNLRDSGRFTSVFLRADFPRAHWADPAADVSRRRMGSPGSSSSSATPESTGARSYSVGTAALMALLTSQCNRAPARLRPLTAVPKQKALRTPRVSARHRAGEIEAQNAFRAIRVIPKHCLDWNDAANRSDKCLKYNSRFAAVCYRLFTPDLNRGGAHFVT